MRVMTQDPTHLYVIKQYERLVEFVQQELHRAPPQSQERDELEEDVQAIKDAANECQGADDVGFVNSVETKLFSEDDDLRLALKRVDRKEAYKFILRKMRGIPRPSFANLAINPSEQTWFGMVDAIQREIDAEAAGQQQQHIPVVPPVADRHIPEDTYAEFVHDIVILQALLVASQKHAVLEIRLPKKEDATVKTVVNELRRHSDNEYIEFHLDVIKTALLNDTYGDKRFSEKFGVDKPTPGQPAAPDARNKKPTLSEQMKFYYPYEKTRSTLVKNRMITPAGNVLPPPTSILHAWLLKSVKDCGVLL